MSADDPFCARHGRASRPFEIPGLRCDCPPSVKVKLLANGRLPTRASPGAAGLDLYARLEFGVCCHVVAAGAHALIATGVCIELPNGFEAQVRPRSGLARDHAVVACLGTVDSDYRGEIGVNLFNFGPTAYEVQHGERIAQLVITEVPRIALTPVDALTETMRGTRGFGSSGK